MGRLERNIGYSILTKLAGANSTAVAAGSGDATEINGDSIQRSTLGSMYLSAQLAVQWRTTLASGATMTVAANIQDSADNVSWVDFNAAASGFGGSSELTAAVVATGPSGGGEVVGETYLDVDLSGARDYVRAQYTPNLSAGSTDTAILSAAIVFGGAENGPAA